MRRTVGLLLPTLLILAGVPALAVTISPIMVELSPLRKVASIRLLNDSAEAMTFQAETLSWQQTGSEDRYEPTRELLVAPAIVQIPPGASQVIRVTLRHPISSDAERAYRLVLEDVTAETSSRPGVVRFRFRHNLPLFATPRQPAVLDSQWRRCPAPANKGCVQLENLGNRRVRLSGVVVEGPDWRSELVGGITVLAGASRQWLFDLKGDPASALRVVATSDTGDTQQAVELPRLIP